MTDFGCAQCRELLGELIDDTLSPGVRAAMRRHLASCAACGELHTSCVATIEIARRATDVKMPAAARRRLRARLATRTRR